MGTHVCVPLTKQHGGQEDTSLALGSERDPVNYRMHSTQNPPLTTLCAYALPPTTVLTHAYNTRERERSKILKKNPKSSALEAVYIEGKGCILNYIAHETGKLYLMRHTQKSVNFYSLT